MENILFKLTGGNQSFNTINTSVNIPLAVMAINNIFSTNNIIICTCFNANKLSLFYISRWKRAKKKTRNEIPMYFNELEPQKKVAINKLKNFNKIISFSYTEKKRFYL